MWWHGSRHIDQTASDRIQSEVNSCENAKVTGDQSRGSTHLKVFKMDTVRSVRGFTTEVRTLASEIRYLNLSPN